MIKIKINLIQKKLLVHLLNYIMMYLILVNLLKSIINLWIMLRFENYKAEKELRSVSPNQKKMRRYVKSL